MATTWKRSWLSVWELDELDSEAVAGCKVPTDEALLLQPGTRRLLGMSSSGSGFRWRCLCRTVIAGPSRFAVVALVAAHGRLGCAHVYELVEGGISPKNDHWRRGGRGALRAKVCQQVLAFLRDRPTRIPQSASQQDRSPSEIFPRTR
jgi:hypothetical protein